MVEGSKEVVEGEVEVLRVLVELTLDPPQGLKEEKEVGYQAADPREEKVLRVLVVLSVLLVEVDLQDLLNGLEEVVQLGQAEGAEWVARENKDLEQDGVWHLRLQAKVKERDNKISKERCAGF